jgi:hypothetical protein
MAQLGQRGTPIKQGTNTTGMQRKVVGPSGPRVGDLRKLSKGYQPATDSFWTRPELQNDRAKFSAYLKEREPGEWGPAASKTLSGSFIGN